jgi:hypothetical protein
MAVAIKPTHYVVAVRQALISAPDRQQAARLLERQAERDETLREALIERFRPHLLSEVCSEAIREAAGEARSVARRAARSDVEYRPLSSRVGAIKAVLDLWTLPDGMKLVRATGLEARHALEYHRDKRRAHDRAVAFYSAVVQRVAVDAIVGEVLSHEELAAMLEAAER